MLEGGRREDALVDVDDVVAPLFLDLDSGLEICDHGELLPLAVGLRLAHSFSGELHRDVSPSVDLSEDLLVQGLLPELRVLCGSPLEGVGGVLDQRRLRADVVDLLARPAGVLVEGPSDGDGLVDLDQAFFEDLVCESLSVVTEAASGAQKDLRVLGWSADFGCVHLLRELDLLLEGHVVPPGFLVVVDEAVGVHDREDDLGWSDSFREVWVVVALGWHGLVLM